MNHILFVCTGNIFRSMIAEHALRYTAVTTSDYSFSSAGTEAKAQPMVDIVRQGLNARGIDPSGHVQRRLTPELFDGADLVVAIGLDHVAFIEETYKETPVFLTKWPTDGAKPFSTPGRLCQITKPTQRHEMHIFDLCSITSGTEPPLSFATRLALSPSEGSTLPIRQ